MIHGGRCKPVDMITYALAKKYAKELLDQAEGDVDGLKSDLEIVDLDGDTASALIINALRQHIWQNEEDAPICEYGSVNLTNTGTFPFNNSQQTVALVKTQKNTKYAVIPEDPTKGDVGDIVVSDKQVNGFKIEFTGSAKSTTVKYIVIGGIIE